MDKKLSEKGREQVALALILLKDYKSKPGELEIELVVLINDLADYLGVRAEYEKLLPIVPPMKIEPRYK